MTSHNRLPNLLLRGRARAIVVEVKEEGEVKVTGTSLVTLCPPDPSSSFPSQRVKTAIEKSAGGPLK